MHRKTLNLRSTEKKHWIGKDQLTREEKMASLRSPAPVADEAENRVTPPSTVITQPKVEIVLQPAFMAVTVKKNPLRDFCQKLRNHVRQLLNRFFN